MTMWIGVYVPPLPGPGESFVEPFKVVAEGANLSAAPSSLLVTYLIPVGDAVTMLEAAAPSGAPAGQGCCRERSRSSSRGCASMRRPGSSRSDRCSRRMRWCLDAVRDRQLRPAC